MKNTCDISNESDDDFRVVYIKDEPVEVDIQIKTQNEIKNCNDDTPPVGRLVIDEDKQVDTHQNDDQKFVIRTSNISSDRKQHSGPHTLDTTIPRSDSKNIRTDPRFRKYQKCLREDIKQILFSIILYNQQQSKLLNTNVKQASIDEIQLILNDELIFISRRTAFHYLTFRQYIIFINQELVRLENEVKINFVNLFKLYEFLNDIKLALTEFLPKFFKITLPSAIKDTLKPIDLGSLKDALQLKHQYRVIDPRMQKRNQVLDTTIMLPVLNFQEREIQKTTKIKSEPKITTENELKNFCEFLGHKDATLKDYSNNLLTMLNKVVSHKIDDTKADVDGIENKRKKLDNLMDLKIPYNDRKPPYYESKSKKRPLDDEYYDLRSSKRRSYDCVREQQESDSRSRRHSSGDRNYNSFRDSRTSHSRKSYREYYDRDRSSRRYERY